MSDQRPWDEAELLEQLIGEAVFLDHLRTNATGLRNIAVDFGIQPTRAYEEERTIQSSFALDEVGGVKTLDIRFPRINDPDAVESMLFDALSAAIRTTSIPNDANIVIRTAGQGKFDPHIKHPHGEQATEGHGTFGTTSLRPRDAVRSATSALDAYHDHLDRKLDPLP